MRLQTVKAFEQDLKFFEIFSLVLEILIILMHIFWKFAQISALHPKETFVLTPRPTKTGPTYVVDHLNVKFMLNLMCS